MPPHPLLLNRARALRPTEKFLAVGHGSKLRDRRLADEGPMEGKGKLGLSLLIQDEVLSKCVFCKCQRRGSETG